MQYALLSLQASAYPRPDHVWLLDKVPDIPHLRNRSFLDSVQHSLHRGHGVPSSYDVAVVEQLLHDSEKWSLWKRMDTVAAAIPLHLLQATSNQLWSMVVQEWITSLKEKAPGSFTHHVLHIDNELLWSCYLQRLVDIIRSVHDTESEK
jgi:hypothetical protein